MKRILLFCAMGALLGCRAVTEPTTDAITLCYAASEPSKTDALTAGDEVAVYARIDGTETYFLEGEKFITGSDGKTLSRMPARYYPETKQAINFYAYFPYHTGTFSVPSNQSTAAALKQADLCWATTKSTPIPTPVSLQFSHLFARLIVSTNQTPSKIACQVVPRGTLNPATGQFTLSNTKSEVYTTGNELILPAQPLNRIVLTVSGVEYVFEGSINLQSSQTTTLNLTLNPATKTATLNGSSTTKWTTSNKQGTPEQTVSNLLTLHWANYVPQGATPNKIIMTIGGTDYTVSSGITYTNKTFVVPFASAALRYPYTISKITFYSGSTQALPGCTQLLGPTIYKSGASTLGINDQASAILINGLWWATGDLVAVGPQGAAKQGGCKIGEPTDGGLYFQFGSLIGWKGGNSANGGNGMGKCNQTNGAFWNGQSSFNWANEAYIWPVEMVGNPTSWPTQGTNQWYFGLQTGWSTNGQNIRTYPGFAVGALANVGIGDPCTYYLGGKWRTPSISECGILTGLTTYGPYYPWGTAGITAKYVYDSDTFDGISMKGGWFGKGITQSATPSLKSALFFNAYSGYRVTTNGTITNIGTGRFLSPTVNVFNAVDNYQPYYNWSDGIAPLGGYTRSRTYGFTVRCVADPD